MSLVPILAKLVMVMLLIAKVVKPQNIDYQNPVATAKMGSTKPDQNVLNVTITVKNVKIILQNVQNVKMDFS